MILKGLAEAARYKGVDYDTIRRWIKTGRLAAQKDTTDHRLYLIESDNLDSVLVGKLLSYTCCPKCHYIFKYKDHTLE